MTKKKAGFAGMNKTMMLFAFEGFFLQYMATMNNYCNNLYATNMGATDNQIGLVQFIPYVVSCILFLPLGALADRQRSSKTLPLITSFVMAAAYMILVCVPSLGVVRMTAFLGTLPLSVGGYAIYNAQWQNFFGDVVEEKDRNNVFAFRNRFMFLVSVIGPLLCGIFLAGAHTDDERLAVLRIVYLFAAVAAVSQGLLIIRIPGGIRSDEQMAELAKHRFSLKDCGEAIRGALSDRDFLIFLLPVMFYYVTWHIDWSMWYIGQTQYLLMNPTHLSIHTANFNVFQFFAIGYVARVVLHKSPHYAMIPNLIGMIISPLIMAFSSYLPIPIRPYTLIFGCAITNIFSCAFNLSVVQMLLQAVPNKNRALIINLYNMLVTLSNGVMPWVGVRIYKGLGADHRAFMIIFIMIASARCVVLAVFVWRYLLLKREGKLFPSTV